MDRMETRRLTCIVDDVLDGSTVEHVLRSRLHLTRRAVSRAKFRPQGITVDGRRALATETVHRGQTVAVDVGDTPDRPARTGTVAAAGELDIVYEDDDLLVVDKAAGMPVHPGPGHFDDTVGNRCMAHWELTGSPAGFHPVHRLDRGTSGLMVVATNAHAQDRLSRTFHGGGFERTYLALCHGVPPHEVGLVDEPIGPGTTLGSWQVDAAGRPSRTRWHVLRSWQTPAGPVSLLELRLETGRSHQIRVHLAWLGCPLLGDALYGGADGAEMPDAGETEMVDAGEADGEPSPATARSLRRPALHSAHLAFDHPVSGQRLSFESPLPPDLARLIP